jgi:hypothetical protein
MEIHRDRTASTRRLLVALACVCSLVLAACGDDDGDDATTGTTAPAAGEQVDGTTDAPSEGSDGEGDAPQGTTDDGVAFGGSGTLVLGEETIELDEVLCYLEPQEAAAGGGQILFTGQGMGVDAAGQDVLLDVSRYDEDSQFAGDVVTVDIGDIMAGESTGLESRTDAGTVEVEGSTIRAEVTLEDFTDFSEVPASFELNC